MVSIVSQFFGILGADLTPPATFAELVPWFMQVCVGFVLIVLVFKFFFSIPCLLYTSRVRRHFMEGKP